MIGIVKSKISMEDLQGCFDQLAEFNGDDAQVIMFHPVAKNYKILPVALEFDDEDLVYGHPFIVFERHITCTLGKVWRLATEIDIVDQY
jgi:hypothetical protein